MAFLKKNRNQEKINAPKNQKFSSNQVSEDDLQSIAGGQDFHSEEEKLLNLERTMDVLNKYQ